MVTSTKQAAGGRKGQRRQRQGVRASCPEGRLLGASTQHFLPFSFLPGLTCQPHLTTREVRQLFLLWADTCLEGTSIATEEGENGCGNGPHLARWTCQWVRNALTWRNRSPALIRLQQIKLSLSWTTRSVWLLMQCNYCKDDHAVRVGFHPETWSLMDRKRLLWPQTSFSCLRQEEGWRVLQSVFLFSRKTKAFL